ncbi:hypothetical protein NEMBOFW57_010664 [Staphylotrichum longicolle]|uniref:Uncharacterized protein n=1 Tax=Staphylotrichum longicolle TaxID=669026 RepID=A0AAD4HVH1_9PEZI|nr:hypothetical protein NEMBOFW57_010664 [Staphylotrichum longicolle]
MGTTASHRPPDFINRHITAIADAEKYRLAKSGSPTRVLIADAVLPSGGYLPVGAATLRGGYLPQYVRDQEHLKGVTSRLLAGEDGGFMFLEILVTDFSEATKEYRKGAGAALVEFYEAQGFQRVDDFVVEKPGEEGWPGTFLRMDLGKKDLE